MIEDIEVVRSARARRMRLFVDPRTGRVRLTLPPRASQTKGVAWAKQHSAWIAAQRAKLPQPLPFAPGARIPIEGFDIAIEWDPSRPRTPELIGAELQCGGPLEGLDRRIERWLRARALACLTKETAEYADRAGVTVRQVAVGDARGRWGSCSTSGSIRYSWRLILAPAAVRRATVAHEVAHRVHMDHSPAFHRCVAELYEGDPEAEREWLRRNGAALHWIGRS